MIRTKDEIEADLHVAIRTRLDRLAQGFPVSAAWWGKRINALQAELEGLTSAKE